MAGLNLYSGDDFCVECSFNSGSTWFELFSTAWEETDEAAPVTQVTAVKSRSGTVVGTQPVQSVTIGMEAANLTDPTFNRLANIGSNANVQFRVTSLASTLKESAASNDTLAIAVASSNAPQAGTFAGTSASYTPATFYADDDLEPGIVAEIGSDLDGTDPIAVLVNKTATANTWYAPATANIETTQHRTIPTAGGAAITAGRYRLVKPGAQRPAFNAKVTLGGAITLRTGEQAASSFELSPLSRLPALKIWMDDEYPT